LQTKAVDLDDSLRVNIADALNEQDLVKFTVHTKVLYQSGCVYPKAVAFFR
jgi:hypothetical protein